MGIADELLALAGHLSTSPPPAFEQASFRRSVSTAYYALFHLLIHEAAERWSGSQAARLGLERVFKHDSMKETSRLVWTGAWKSWSTPQLAVPIELKNLAEAFVRLQEARHVADYDNTKIWTFMEVDARLTQARMAFRYWQKIEADPASQEYLLALLIGKKRE
jgi:uncharacterized protein (UPF0332 family)